MRAWLEKLNEEAYWWQWIDENNPTYECTGPQPTHIGYVLLILWDKATRPFKLLWCKLFGCDMECYGWGGPDSGGESFHCSRCDNGYTTKYY